MAEIEATLEEGERREMVEKYLEEYYVDDIENWITFDDPTLSDELNEKIKKEARKLKEEGKKWIDNDLNYIAKIDNGDLEYLVGYTHNEAIETYIERVDEGIEEED